MSKVTNDFGDIEFEVPDNVGTISGNRGLSNRFAITLLTNVRLSPLSFGYGGNINKGFGVAASGADVSAISASISGACDDTVNSIKSDQELLPLTEKISSAFVESVEKVGEKVYISIRIIPVELDQGAVQGPLLTVPL